MTRIYMNLKLFHGLEFTVMHRIFLARVTAAGPLGNRPT